MFLKCLPLANSTTAGLPHSAVTGGGRERIVLCQCGEADLGWPLGGASMGLTAWIHCFCLHLLFWTLRQVGDPFTLER